MAVTLFSGPIVASGNNVPSPFALPSEYSSVTVTVSSAYSATAATTGVKLQVQESIDGGVTYSDLTTVATTAPTPSSGTAVSSEQFAILSVGTPGATHLKFKLVNQDATNNATTVSLQVRAA